MYLILRFLTLKFVFSKKATKIAEIFTIDLTLCSKCQIDSEDFVDFCGLLRKHELYNVFDTPAFLFCVFCKIRCNILQCRMD